MRNLNLNILYSIDHLIFYWLKRQQLRSILITEGNQRFDLLIFRNFTEINFIFKFLTKKKNNKVCLTIKFLHLFMSVTSQKYIFVMS
jgi:hypothetical protein